MSDDLLSTIAARAMQDLFPHRDEFDAIVCGGDRHGMVLGAAIAAYMGKPLAIIWRSPVSWTISDITCFGDVLPRGQRLLYVDDWFTLGRTKAEVFAYLDSCGEQAPVVATYEVNTRRWEETGRAVTVNS